MTTRPIDAIAGENASLELHTRLCAARYQQIADVLNSIESRLAQLDLDLAAVSRTIETTQDRLTDRIFAWGTAVIAFLTGTTGWLIVHYVLP